MVMLMIGACVVAHGTSVDMDLVVPLCDTTAVTFDCVGMRFRSLDMVECEAGLFRGARSRQVLPLSLLGC